MANTFKLVDAKLSSPVVSSGWYLGREGAFAILKIVLSPLGVFLPAEASPF